MRGPLDVRFWAKVNKTETCWLWTGAKHSSGYGVINTMTEKGLDYAHRISYAWARGPIPEGLHIDHLCRVVACVNPDHLEAVTMAENIRRGVPNLGNLGRYTDHCPKGHSLSGPNLYMTPKGWRNCRACRRVQVKACTDKQTNSARTHCAKGHGLDGNDRWDRSGRRLCLTCAAQRWKRAPETAYYEENF